VQFYRELCVKYEVLEHAEEAEVINLGTMRLLADQCGRNVYRLYRAAQWHDKNGELRNPTVDSTAAALCKRPWNADLKRLTFLASDCFMKFQNHPDDYYGQMYVARKAQEIDRNERGLLAEQARTKLETTKIGKSTKAYGFYSEGKLPPDHIHMRTLRYVGKIFLSHVHHAMYVDYFGTEPPVPYVFAHSDGDHRHFIPLPNFPWTGGGKPLKELLDGRTSAPSANGVE
jgi:hypothetical protein